MRPYKLPIEKKTQRREWRSSRRGASGQAKAPKQIFHQEPSG